MKISDAKKLLTEIVQYNLKQCEAGKSHNTYVVPMLQGDPGVGKTAAAKQVARECGIPYHQCIIAQYDAGELAGLPFKSEIITKDVEGVETKEDRMIRLRPNYLPTDPVGVFNLDELPQAFLANQNIASQLVNEYRVGEHEISPGMTIVATGNKPENKAGTTTMPSHLKDRLLFIDLEANKDEFMAYAITNGIDPRIRAWLQEHSDHLHKFDPKAPACPTPRSWEKASAILSMDLPKHIRTQTLAGQLGEGEAHEFEAFLRVEEKMPKISDILAHPEDENKAPVFNNKEADLIYLLLTTLADVADKSNIGNIIKYINRMPNQEFAAYWAQQTFHRNEELLQCKEVTEWKLKNFSKLLY